MKRDTSTKARGLPHLSQIAARGRALGLPPLPDVGEHHPGSDKNYHGAAFEATLAGANGRLLRPARRGEPGRVATALFKPLRQIIESINQTFKGQLDLERHGDHTRAGVTVRILQRTLALTAAIWHNDITGQPTLRSLVSCDH